MCENVVSPPSPLCYLKAITATGFLIWDNLQKQKKKSKIRVTLNFQTPYNIIMCWFSSLFFKTLIFQKETKMYKTLSFSTLQMGFLLCTNTSETSRNITSIEKARKFSKTDNSGMTILNSSKAMLNMVIGGNDFVSLLNIEFYYVYSCCSRCVLHELVTLEHWHT